MPLKLDSTCLRLRPGAPAVPLPVDTSFWPRLPAGAVSLVPRDTRHTARVRKPARMLCITPGEGTVTRGSAEA